MVTSFRLLNWLLDTKPHKLKRSLWLFSTEKLPEAKLHTVARNWVEGVSRASPLGLRNVSREKTCRSVNLRPKCHRADPLSLQSTKRYAKKKKRIHVLPWLANLGTVKQVNPTVEKLGSTREYYKEITKKY